MAIVKKAFWVYDIGIFSNCTVFIFENYQSEERHTFVINRDVNDFSKLINFLRNNVKNKDWHFGFNNLKYNTQIIEYIIRNRHKLSKERTNTISSSIYYRRLYIVSNYEEGNYADYPEWELSIPVADVYKINHWDNAKRRCSLEWFQYSTDGDMNELLHPFEKPVENNNKLNDIISHYIKNVVSIKKAFKLSKDRFNLRSSLKNKYNLNCFNYSDAKIGSELLLKFYCEDTGINIRTVRKSRTNVQSIDVGEILFDYIGFKSDTFKNFHENLKFLTIYNTKGDFSEVVKFEGYVFTYGLGGIHQCIEKGIYKSDDQWIVIDADAKGMYPNIEVENGMYPSHLGPQFTKVLKEKIVSVRNSEKEKPKSEQDVTIIDSFKEAGNASYGKSNSAHSWLFDRRYTMQTTINGQLSLTMLIEDIVLSIEDAELLQTNTDGMTFRIRRSDLDEYYRICKKWEEKTKLTLEFETYKQMIIADTNTYIAQYEDGTIKDKGRFGWQDFEKYNIRTVHKNKSYLVIAKAINEYFINGVKPEDYLETNKNIYDYCAGAKLKKDWFFEESYLDHSTGEFKTVKITGLLRFFISVKGTRIVKRNIKSKKPIQLENDNVYQTIMNKYIEKDWEEYGIDIRFYLRKIYSEIRAIEAGNIPSPQLSLF